MGKKRQGDVARVVKDRLTLVQDYRKFFNTEYGKRILHDLMRENYFLKPMVTKDMNAIDLAYKEGGRNAVLRIFSICEIDPAVLEKHIVEASRNVKNTQ